MNEKEKEKIKERIRKTTPEQVRISKSGYWTIKDNEPVFLEETVTQLFFPVTRTWKVVLTETETKTPKDFGWKKEVSQLIVLVRQVPSLETFRGMLTVFYKQELRYAVRPDRTYIYLKREGNKVMIRDFYGHGRTLECVKNSNKDVVVSKGKTKRVSVDEIKKLAKEGKISEVYTKVIDEPKGRVYGKGRVLKPIQP